MVGVIGRMGRIGRVGSSRPVQGGYAFANPEAAAYAARMDLQPDDARKALIDTLFGALKAAGVLTKLSALWLMAAHNAQAARLNLISASYSLVAVSSPSFTVDRGYQGDASASYLRTGLTPSTDPLYLQNSATLGCWSLTNQASNTFVLGARVAFDSQQSVLAPRTATSAMNGRVNVGVMTEELTPIADSRGMFSASRTGPTTTHLYRNGGQLSNYSNVSTAPVGHEMYLLGANQNGSLALPSSRQLAAAFVGGGLTSGETLALYNALNNYLTSIGAV